MTRARPTRGGKNAPAKRAPAKRAPAKRAAAKSAAAKRATAKRATAKRAPGAGAPRGGPVEFEGVRITHPDRVLYRAQGITKLDLVRYYVEVSPVILPHLAGRPLTLVRCPEGQEKPCFFQKHGGESVPEAVRRLRIEEKEGKTATYLAVDDLPGLIATVQMGVLELHVWNARAARLEQPDQLVLDLDPAPDVAWEAVVRAALELGRRVADLGLHPFVKTTGGKGLHVVVPLVPRLGWDEVRDVSRALAIGLARDQPRAYLTAASKAKRRGKIFIDWLRNARGATAICPYSTRARPGATVATPIAWDEVDPSLDPARFTVASLGERLAGLERDPWADFEGSRRSITKQMRRALGLD